MHTAFACDADAITYNTLTRVTLVNTRQTRVTYQLTCQLVGDLRPRHITMLRPSVTAGASAPSRNYQSTRLHQVTHIYIPPYTAVHSKWRILFSKLPNP